MKKVNSSGGSSRIVFAAMGSSGSGSGGDCCDMSLKCWCRWRWEHCFLSTTFLFLLLSLVVFGVVAGLFAWLAFPPYDRPESSSLGCQPDGEGSWAIGMFYGDSPFSLKPIESRNVWKNESSTWPVANPVFTCSSASDAGFPSNFVADPFLFSQVRLCWLFEGNGLGLSLQSRAIRKSGRRPGGGVVQEGVAPGGEKGEVEVGDGGEGVRDEEEVANVAAEGEGRACGSLERQPLGADDEGHGVAGAGRCHWGEDIR